MKSIVCIASVSDRPSSFRLAVATRSARAGKLAIANGRTSTPIGSSATRVAYPRADSAPTEISEAVERSMKVRRSGHARTTNTYGNWRSDSITSGLKLSRNDRSSPCCQAQPVARATMPVVPATMPQAIAVGPADSANRMTAPRIVAL